jgi:tmRNA-binding protein
MDHCTITEGIIRIDHDLKTLKIINMDIPLYSKTQQSLVTGYIPKQARTLLLNKKEITRIVASVKQ